MDSYVFPVFREDATYLLYFLEFCVLNEYVGVCWWEGSLEVDFMNSRRQKLNFNQISTRWRRSWLSHAHGHADLYVSKNCQFLISKFSWYSHNAACAYDNTNTSYYNNLNFWSCKVQMSPCCWVGKSVNHLSVQKRCMHTT